MILTRQANAHAQRPPPESPGRMEKSLRNFTNRATVHQGGGSLHRRGWTTSSLLMMIVNLHFRLCQTFQKLNEWR
jgi:hypothetical protein